MSSYPKTLPKDVWWPGFERQATAVGYVCMQFATLEMIINNFVEMALGCSEDERRSIVDATGMHIGNRLDLISKLVILDKPNDEFFNDLELLFNFTKTHIMKPRNRIIHDHWDNPAAQTDFRSTLRKTRPREPKTLSAPVNVQRSVRDLFELSKDMVEVRYAIEIRALNYEEWKRTRKLPASPPLPKQCRKRSPQG